MPSRRRAGDLLQPVGAEILVPEAAGDLVVALEAGDDKQLLVESAATAAGRKNLPGWRRLGTRKSRAPPASACPDRRLDVDKAAASISWRNDRDQPSAGADALLELVAAQVEPAYLIRSVSSTFSSSSWKGSGVERERIVSGVDLQLDGAVGSSSFDLVGRARDDLALGLETNSLRIAFARSRPRRRVPGDDELADPGLVAQVDEDEPPWSRRRAVQPASVTR